MTRLRTLLLALAACGGTAPTQPGKPTVEPDHDAFAAVRDRLQLATDGTHYFAYAPPRANVGGRADGALLFHSRDGKTYDQVEIDDVVDEESDAWVISYIDPRFTIPAGELKLDKGVTIVTCRGREHKLVPASPEETQRLLRTARLLPNRNSWNTVALGRDTAGTHYYIDAGYGADNRDQVRLFVGKPGAMKETPLIMADKRDWPNLRLVTQEGMLKVEVDTRGKNPTSTLWWTVGGRTSKVMVQDMEKQGLNPWGELGIYQEKRGATPCDALL